MVFQTSTITVQSDESAQSGLPMLGDLQGQVLEPLRTGVRVRSTAFKGSGTGSWVGLS